MKLGWFKFNFSYPLTIVGTVLCLILGIKAASKLWTYAQLTVKVSGVVDEWKIVKKSSSSFPIQASYHFEFQGKTYHHKTVLMPPYHLNRPSAEKALQNIKNLEWGVWINPHNPHLSALQKEFPTKKIFYFLIALGVTIYFGFLETTSRIRSPIH